MVVKASLAAANGSHAIVQADSSVAQDLEAKAITALAAAHDMPPGNDRTEAINQATVFRNAAAIHQMLGGKRRDPSA